MAKPNRTPPTKPDPDTEWLTVPEVCWVLRKSPAFVYVRLRAGHAQHIDSKLVGRSRLVSRAALERFLDAQPATRSAA